MKAPHKKGGLQERKESNARSMRDAASIITALRFGNFQLPYSFGIPNFSAHLHTTGINNVLFWQGNFVRSTFSALCCPVSKTKTNIAYIQGEISVVQSSRWFF